MFKKIVYSLTLALAIACSSSSDDSGDDTNKSYDRKAMLTNIAENIILPAYGDYYSATSNLKAATTLFATTTNEVNLETLRDKWQDAYLAWQTVSMFEIGKAEELKLRNWTNIYPTNVANINTNITDLGYNLELPSTNSQQGFPALDYLLFGTGASTTEIVAYFSTTPNAVTYLTELTTKLDNQAATVLTDWTVTYKTTFIENSGSSASSSTDKLVNDYIFYYEKFLRSGKIGFPSGALSGTKSASDVEAFYKKDISKLLFNKALDAAQNFFEGKHHSGSGSGESLKAYLVALDRSDIATKIVLQFEAIRIQANLLDDNFSLQVETDNSVMLKTRDELQKNTVYFKTDMLSALNIAIDYVDNDGD